MSRSAIAVVAALLVVGCIVAMLPAQESSRRRASSFQVSPEGAEADANLSSQLRASSDQVAQEYGAPAGRTAGQPVPADALKSVPALPQELSAQPAPLAADQTAQPMPTDAATGQLRSVLKRSGRPAVIYESPAPSSLAPAAGTQPIEPSGISVSASQPMRIEGAAARDGFDASSPSGRRTLPPRVSVSSLRGDGVDAPARVNVPPRNIGSSIQDLSLSGRNAALRVDLAGPQGIEVGKPAAYVIHVTNESDTPAEEVFVRLALPGAVTVTGTQPSNGEAEMQVDGQGQPRLVWSLPQVGARGHDTLRVELVTNDGASFDLGLDWTTKPSALVTPIVVKQAQLALSLSGPAEMVFGEEKTFTLSVANPGNGAAERVAIMVATGSAPAQQVDVGDVPAGSQKELPLTIVASQAGEIEISVSASGEGNLTAQASARINVRKAELQIAVEAPELKFAGSEAVYSVSITNAGNAPADGVQLALALPAESKYIGGIDGAAASLGSVKWSLPSLAPGASKAYQVKVQLLASGINQLVVQAQAAAAGQATAEAQTQVEAVADLKLAVNDPSGPVATSDQAVYEVQVTNRGSQSAEQVRIVMQFGEGIEPIAFEGCEARIVPGQVLCQPLADLGAGEQLKIRVRARAEQPGSHQFRVEVTSAGDTRLVSEGTTRFFSESGLSGAAATTAQQPTPATLR